MSFLRSSLLWVALPQSSNTTMYGPSPLPTHNTDDYPSKQRPTGKRLNIWCLGLNGLRNRSELPFQRVRPRSMRGGKPLNSNPMAPRLRMSLTSRGF